MKIASTFERFPHDIYVLDKELSKLVQCSLALLLLAKETLVLQKMRKRREESQ